jgi:HKD family nuclease
MIHVDDLGHVLLKETEQANSRIVLVAPFIKRRVVDRLLQAASASVTIDIVTRWSVHDVAMGASDPDVWEAVCDRDNATMRLISNLHAKYYRFDDRYFIGSANLTQKALGWSQPNNVEVLVSAEGEDAASIKQMLKGGIEVTDELYRRFLLRVEESEIERPVNDNFLEEDLPEGTRVSEPSATYEVSEWWTPSMRQPSQLYDVYAGEPDDVTRAGKEQAWEDLRHFAIQVGLSREAFEAEVAWQLFQKPVVQEINSFTESSRRFGAVRDHLKGLPCAERSNFDATRAWQTLIRWLLYFMPDEYEMDEANYSETFRRVK